MDPVTIEQTAAGVRLHLRVRAGSQRQGVVGVHDGAVRVHVHAAPEAGKANKSVVAVLAKALGVAKGAVEITAGHANPQKTALVRGADAAAVRAALEAVLDDG